MAVLPYPHSPMLFAVALYSLPFALCSLPAPDVLECTDAFIQIQGE